MKKVLPLFIVLLLISCNAAKPHYSEIKMCENIDEFSNFCIEDQKVYNSETKRIYITGKLVNAPKNTELNIAWIYLGNETPQYLLSSQLGSKSTSSLKDLEIFSFLDKPDEGWPKGPNQFIISNNLKNGPLEIIDFYLE